MWQTFVAVWFHLNNTTMVLLASIIFSVKPPRDCRAAKFTAVAILNLKAASGDVARSALFVCRIH